MKNQKSKGVIISYINIILNMVCNFYLTPFIIGVLADESYSIYKVMQSFAAPLSMLTFGGATIVARAIAKHNASDNDNKRAKENTFALTIIISGCFSCLIIAIGYIMSLSVASIYGPTYSPEMIKVAVILFRIYSINTAVHVFTEPFRGCIIGWERFVFRFGSQTLEYLLHFVLVILLLKNGFGVLALGATNLFVTSLIFVLYFLYSFFILKERPHLYHIDKGELLGIASFSIAILLQAFVNQINNSMDNMILGAMVVEKSIVTMYSSALTIYTVYSSLIQVFSGVYLPQATKLVTRGASGEELTDFVVKPGRIQAMIAVAVCCCFGLFGENFIDIWIGHKYVNAYYVTLMLIIPVTIPLVESICVSILDAKLKRLYRSIALAIMAIINFLVSIVLVNYFSFWGAAIGTMASILLGHGLFMNIYYQRNLKINVSRMFRSIFHGVLPSGIIATIVCIPMALFLNNTVIMFFIKCAIFVILYAVLLWLVGFNVEEKDYFKHKFIFK